MPESKTAIITPSQRTFVDFVSALSNAFYIVAYRDGPSNSLQVEGSVLRSNPGLADLIDNDLVLRRNGHESAFLEKVVAAPQKETDSIFSRLRFALAVTKALSFSQSNRLRPFLVEEGIFLPQTRTIFADLKKTVDATEGLSEDQLPVDTLNPTHLTIALSMLEEEIAHLVQSDEYLSRVVQMRSRIAAEEAFFDITTKKKRSEIDSLVSQIVEQRRGVLAKDKVVVETEGGLREFSRLNVMLNEIIDEENLRERALQERRYDAVIKERKEKTKNFLIKERVIRRIARLIPRDEVFFSMTSKLSGLSTEELRLLEQEDDPKLRLEVARQIYEISQRDEDGKLKTKKAKSLVKGGLFIPDLRTLVKEETERLLRSIEAGPFVFAASLSSSEQAFISNLIPRIHDFETTELNRNLFLLASQILDQRLKDRVSQEDILALLETRGAKQIVTEICRQSLDRTIIRMGIGIEELLRDPYALIQNQEELVRRSFDSLSDMSRVEDYVRRVNEPVNAEKHLIERLITRLMPALETRTLLQVALQRNDREEFERLGFPSDLFPIAKLWLEKGPDVVTSFAHPEWSGEYKYVSLLNLVECLKALGERGIKLDRVMVNYYDTYPLHGSVIKPLAVKDGLFAVGDLFGIAEYPSSQVSVDPERLMQNALQKLADPNKISASIIRQLSARAPLEGLERNLAFRLIGLSDRLRKLSATFGERKPSLAEFLMTVEQAVASAILFPEMKDLDRPEDVFALPSYLFSQNTELLNLIKETSSLLLQTRGVDFFKSVISPGEGLLLLFDEDGKRQILTTTSRNKFAIRDEEGNLTVIDDEDFIDIINSGLPLAELEMLCLLAGGQALHMGSEHEVRARQILALGISDKAAEYLNGLRIGQDREQGNEIIEMERTGENIPLMLAYILFGPEVVRKLILNVAAKTNEPLQVNPQELWALVLGLQPQ